ncbi:hypothetical protein NL108_015572, partial [Boleophthalmus pectinirostris]
QVSWGLKIKTKTKVVPPCLGMFRPTMGHCCHQCTPESLTKAETPTVLCKLVICISVHRYQGWLVRRMCCALFVSGCKAFTSPVTDRAERVYQSKRYPRQINKDAKYKMDRCQMSLKFHSTFLFRFVSWLLLKMLASVFGSVQVNLNHLLALHKASQEGSPLVYVYLQQSALDCALIPLALFCHSLRIPYTICPVNVNNRLLRMILQKVGVILLLNGDLTEEEFERDPLSSAVMTSLVRELLHEGQAVSVAVSALPGQGGQWLARIRQLIKEGSVPDVSLVPVGISYNCVPPASPQVDVSCLSLKIGLSGVVKRLLSLLWTRSWGSVRIDLAQPFSLKEMCDSGRCRVDDWLPLQDLLLPVILNNRDMQVMYPPPEKWAVDLSLNDIYDINIVCLLSDFIAAMSCKSVMSTGIVSSLLLHRHPKLSVLCRDVSWLTKELLFRNKDVGFGGTLARVVHYALSLLAPHLIMSAAPSRKDPLILPRPSPAAAHHLSLQAQTVTHAFILEAVGACAVSAMLRDVAGSGVSSHVRSHGVDGAKVKGDLEFDVVLCETELTNRALQLCHLLPPGFMPPCQSSHSFALDAVDSLVRCGILIMEEVPRAVPICDVWKRDGTFSWATSDDPYSTDSDCEEMESRSYK